jgi:glycosyltransferase involved in cell wall biosynthesis
MINISVIIPSNNCKKDLLIVVNAICQQTIKPKELVIVDSSNHDEKVQEEILILCEINKIKLVFIKLKYCLPGHARNIAFEKTTCELIAFIDVKTIPVSRWLEESIQLLNSYSAMGVWGATSFKAIGMLDSLIRDSFHGALPRTTLPGTICKREVFLRVGQFIDWVRAGEDTEWMLRLKILKIPFVTPSIKLTEYVGLTSMGFRELIKKWHRNYTASCDLPQFYSQRNFLWVTIYPLIILIALNWNYLIADWRIESPFYIGHITKIVVIFPFSLYIIFRGIILPLKRGVSIRKLLPLRFIAVTGICFVADAIKIFIFLNPKRRNF